MLRKLFLVALILIASVASARQRAAAHPQTRPDAATVYGIVTSVSGNIISIADGLVTIDAAQAKIAIPRILDATIADIRPGMLVFAMVRPATSANAPLQATMITATEIADATLSGPVEAVDLGNRTLTLLGRTIHVTDETSFGGFRHGGTPRLEDVVPNQVAHVQTDVVNGRLVATSVLVVAPMPSQVSHARGTVKSIGTDEWVIARERESDLTLAINAQTRISGAPKVGDAVEVLYTVNAAHANVAIAIVKFERPVPPQHVRVSGTVKSMAAALWVVTDADGNDVSLTIEPRTRIAPGIRTGDRIEALAERRGDGTLVALMIMGRR